jgi:hypothetical protein
MSTDSSTSVPFSAHAVNPGATPQNTPANPAPIASRLSRPTVADINENSDEEEEDSARNPSQQAIGALMQHKLAGLIGKSSGYIESLPVPIKRRVEGLKGIGTEYDKLMKEHKKELYELEKKVRSVKFFSLSSFLQRSSVLPFRLTDRKTSRSILLYPSLYIDAVSMLLMVP